MYLRNWALVCGKKICASIDVKQRAFHCTRRLQKDWNVIRLNHVALATNELDRVTKLYRDVLGCKVSILNFVTCTCDLSFTFF